MKTEEKLEYAMGVAHGASGQVFGHKLGPFEMCGLTAASADCLRPGCNMGLTVDCDVPGFDFAVLGAAVAHHCASAERPLRDPLTLLYRVDPAEGQ
jgi:hypothetical protein